MSVRQIERSTRSLTISWDLDSGNLSVDDTDWEPWMVFGASEWLQSYAQDEMVKRLDQGD